ncbi:MAG: laccase domain-containing protein [Bacilli bacterium]|nr:laccase domain-containing protein [Bacilli bacterium]
MKNRNVVHVDTGRLFGNMNTNKAFFPEDYTAEQRRQDFFLNRCNAAYHYGFDPRMTFMALQNDKKGTYKKLDREYVEAYADGWDADIDEDILLITEDIPEVVIGHPVADCPVVMMTDYKNGISAIGHCSAEMIDKKLPMMIADALVEAAGSKDEDIYTYVSACAGSNWTYDKWPDWAKDKELWKEAIYQDKKGIFHIDMRTVISKQLHERNILGIRKVKFNQDDTITNPYYFSNSAASPYGLNDKSKAGRNFAGLFYQKEQVKEKVLTKKYFTK